jgi:hypothetical protein
MSEWRQFQMLARVSLGRLMDTAVASRETDAVQFVIWTFALVTTPPLFYAMRMMGKYSFMWRRPDLLEQAAIADRLFFIVYAMIAAGLLAAMLWDALLPDRQDQEIVGVLPVRPRTLAAARVATAIGVATAFAVGIAIPCGLVYTVNVAMAFKSTAVLGWFPAVFAAHLLTMTAAGTFTFAGLLTLRALAVIVVGAETARRAAILLQLVTILLLVETLIFLPGLLYAIVARLDLSDPTALRIPPLWFMSLYASLSGPPSARAPLLTLLALGATAGLVVLTCLLYVGSARWHARQVIEARLQKRAGRSMGFLLGVASPALRAPTARAVFAFTVASLARSPRHLMKIASYLGAAIAVGAVSLMAAAVRDRPLPVDAPADYLLALPLVATFFLVMGLRSAFAVPTNPDGNWVFRVGPPRSTAQCVHALVVVLMALGVLPVTLVWITLTTWWWGWEASLAGGVLHAVSGLAFVELTLIGCRSIPFTRPHIPASRTVRGDWIFALIALFLFGFVLADVQVAAIRSTNGVIAYTAVAIAVAVGARLYRRTRRIVQPLTFDAPVERSVEALNLSQAVG